MEIVKTSIEGLVIIQPRVFEDERGYFMESYKESFIKDNFPDIDFIQDNESKSTYGVLRGLHFQKAPFEQTKLVRVIDGEVLDVALDLRKIVQLMVNGSLLFYLGRIKKQFFIPKGFAHGFVVLSKEAIFSYKVDNIYAPDYDSGIYFNDKNLAIDWIIPESDLVISQKDLNLQFLKQQLNDIYESN